MTREEAVKVLNMVDAHEPLVSQAKEMAIEALQREIKRKDHFASAIYRLSLSVWVDDVAGEYELRDKRRCLEARLPFHLLEAPRCVEEQLIEELCKGMQQIQPTVFGILKRGAEMESDTDGI